MPDVPASPVAEPAPAVATDPRVSTESGDAPDGRATAEPTRARRPVTGVLRTTAVVATAGVVAALIGLGVMVLPVRSPLQDCGTSLAFLLDGRTDVTGDPAAPPEGKTRADVEETNRRPCRERVAGRARIAGIFLVGGLLVAVAATLTEVAARWRLYRRSTRPDARSPATATPAATATATPQGERGPPSDTDADPDTDAP